ncbi:related to TEL2 Protein involved in controlling telomere length and position effect [Fusarium fujikuroi IMI 58289]|uniref:Related to TEL2 Protein involved in controlling telomere length and position effect n=1 Tax=Gibberella fujikuroi (strain CBS 195.34 / IMI 58289 / NRRL A-6831) TaxID=1279085 RepID=S0DJP9_GIBF5|nr:related to TEL2 Protein involved in controlling telomere length and position effect [Fusarium fujikuroi IMI 58289]KLP20812.1 TEL2 Protein involved in controlling telomere length and position effect [Fusarium fujikuroi]CCT62565.1 related to TEL2 Protein involved in controlling telomere length and position effect [Fusarium fujikuroi IMI 58289]SCN74370.1 related to TEL2 Protein involved in controlling telomere length and position effect [Fusarium fujikuroi]
MDNLLTPVSTTYLKPRNEPEPLFTEVKPASTQKKPPSISDRSTADEIIDALKSQPDYDTLISILNFLNNPKSASSNFSFSTPSPKSASIIHLLVSEIASNYWTLLLEGDIEDDTKGKTELPRDADLFIGCLRSLTGLNAVITQLRVLIQESRLGGKEERRADLSINAGILLSILSSIIGSAQSISTIWSTSIKGISSVALQRVQCQKLVSILSNGQIVSIAAEALEVMGRGKVDDGVHWIADGLKYSTWVGNAIVSWVHSSPEPDGMAFAYELFQKSLSLHHSETLIRIAINGLLLSKRNSISTFIQLALSQHRTSKKVFHILLQHLSQKYLNRLSLEDTQPDDKVSAVAGLLMEVALNDETRRDVLISWCASSSGAGVGDGVGIRRAVVAALARDREAITTVLEKSIAQFGDELYIRHSAMLQQDAHTQILLLAAGYVHRVSPMKLTLLMRVGTYMNTISNRIGSTQPRAQFLGLVVGESLSALIDDKKQRLDFKMEQTETEEAQQLKNLTNVSDPVGPIDPILFDHAIETVPQKRKPSTPSEALQKKAKQKKKPLVTEPKPKAIIEEIDSSEEDDDLAPYSKDSDPEDSDDDATLVQRNKPKPPVYIRDLISYFRDSESYDKQLLALQTAPILIRRKANYGTEVSFHADELAELLVGIQDKFEIENFDDLRLHSMLALVVSQPKTMAPWFARTFFEGDYSLHQRTSILVTLGLSARELAGFEVSQYQSAAAFPSKRLPEKMEQLYIGSGNDSSSLPSSQLKALPSTALENISQSLTSSFLAPLAAEAADANTGPDILKLQSFTARYKSKSSSKPRMRAIPNTTAALLATSFFSPLTAHFQVALRSAKPIILNHALLALYLQTLGVVVHAAGPSTLSLPQLTAELWDLLLGVRVHVFGDLGAMKGWLVAMASLLEVNGGDMRRLCETQGREVMETREWVAMVFEKTRGEDGGEENEVKMLAAGVLIRLGEAIERYQALLMGDLVGFQ